MIETEKRNQPGERARERYRERSNGDGDGNAASVMVDERRSSLRSFRYHFSTVLLRKHVPGINELTISG